MKAVHSAKSGGVQRQMGIPSLVLAAALVTGSLVSPASATSITWDVSHLTFTSGPTLSGSFTVETTGAIDSWDITVTEGPQTTVFKNGLNGGTATEAGSINHGVSFTDVTGESLLLIASQLTMFDTASLPQLPIITACPSGTACDVSVLDVFGHAVQFDDGSYLSAPSAVPGPVVGAGLPGLIVAGVGMLGWRRRKRKAGAAA